MNLRPQIHNYVLLKQNTALIFYIRNKHKDFFKVEEGKEVTDVSSLGNVHTLDLSGIWGITDVSSLGNAHTLNLFNCQGITDVSSLGNVHTLNLSNCHQITDVSSLGNVHTLIMIND